MKNIFLLPGLDGSGVILQKLSEALTRLGMRVFVVSYPKEDSYNYEDYANYVKNYINECIGVEQSFSVFAESFGGPIIPLLYKSLHSRIEKIIFCASFVTNPMVGARVLKFFNKSIQASRISSLAYMVNFLGLNPSSDAVEIFNKAQQGLTDSLVRARINEVLSLSNSGKELAHFNNISTPILYIQARYDTVVLPKGYFSLKRLNPHTQLKVLSSSHLVSYVQSHKVAEEIYYFLNDIV